MQMNGNHRSDDNSGWESPLPSETNESPSDFEIEDSTLLGGRRIAYPVKEQWRRHGAPVWARLSGYVRSTKWGRKAEAYLVNASKRTRHFNLLVTVAVVMLLGILFTFSHRSQIHRTLLLPNNPFCRSSDSTSTVFFKKPAGTKIYGLVFYGRRRTVEILDCYLRKNLVSNGGWLDEIHFLINTPVQEDLDWIAELLPKVKDYKGIYLTEGTDMRDFESVWRQGLQHSSSDLYVKLDDDLVWMSDFAIEEVVTSLLTHPEAFVVLGNLIDSAALGWVHHRYGAIDSYLPELEQPSGISDSYGPKAWRASKLPTHPHPPSKDPFFANDGDWDAQPPYPNHRWLPLRDNQTLLPLTPIWRTEYDANSWDWNHWQLGAQQHYSFLSNLERDELRKYHFGDKHSGLWNMRFMHANINLMAVWANDILDHLPFITAEDDEAHFTMTLPRVLKRECYIQTRAIASHFSFGPQGGMYSTDLLARYRAYANEHVCKEVGVHIESLEEWPGENR